MLNLRGKDKVKIAGLVDYKNLYIEKELASGDKTLAFLYPKTSKFYSDIEEECYITTKEDEFIVKEKNVLNDYTEFKCILNLEDLEGKPWERYASEEQTIDKALALALAGTGWIVGNCSLKKKRTVRATNVSSLDIIQQIRKTYRCDLVFNTLTKTIDVYERLGEDKGTYFIDSLNLKNLAIQGNSYSFFTRIIPIGKDNLRISDINNGKDYLENFQYSNKVKTYYWIDERYTIVENLKEDAAAKLDEISKPYRAYVADIINLAKLNDKYKDILDFKLGDTVHLISKDNKFRDKQRIVKIIEHPDEHELDSVEIANTTLSFEEKQTQFEEVADTIDNITTDNGTIDGSTVDGIETNQIKDFEDKVIKVTNIDAISGKIHNLEVHNITITGELTAVEATIGTLNSNLATIDKLTVTHSAYIADLQASKVSITQLEAVNATIQVLEGNVSNFETSLSKKASIEQLNATNVIIVELQAKKANIDDLNATNAIITELKATKADIKDLQATNANIANLSSDLANIKTLVNGNLSSENIQAGGITSDKLTIANGFITNAMIANLDVSKVNAGDISTSKFRIKSDDGGIEIVGATQQFKDKNNKVRIQMGKDAQGNFNFIIRGEDGTTTLIDHTGIKQKAIADDLIISNMISSDAVGEKQINYNSFVTGFNKDTNTNTLKATKIKLDNQNQSLEIAFNSLKTQSDGTKNITESHSTSINVMQGQINTAINNTQIVKDGQTILLKDDYNRTVQTVNSINSTLGSHSTQINEATGKITSVDTKVNSVQRDLESTKISVSSNSSKITDLNTVTKNQSSDINVLKSQISLKVEQSDIEKSINETQKVTDEKISNAKAEIKITTDAINQTVSSLNSTISTKADNSTVNNVSNKVSSLETNLNSITGKVGNLETSVTTKADKSTTYTKTETDALIKVKTDEINLNLTKNYSSKTDLTNAINNIEIGGRNLLLDSKKERVASPREYLAINITDIAKDNLDKKVTFSGLIKTNGKDGTVAIYSLGKYGINCATSIKCTTSSFIRFEMTGKFTYNSNGDNGDVCNLSFYGTYGSGIFPVVKEIKVELGTMATDWTPAPEDFEVLTDEKISNAKAEIKITTDAINQTVSNLTTTVSTKADNSTVTSMSNKVASLETSLNGIKGEVSSLETTTTTISSKVNQAQSDATKGINDAKTASDKALSAQNTANTNKNNITTLTTEVTTVKSNIATLDVNLKGITQRVSSTESTTISLNTQMNKLISPHGMPYTKDLIIYGDSDKYYPVYIIGGNQDILRTIKIWRSYSEQAPSDWNTSTHKGSLMLTWQGNFGGLGGADYKEFILENSSQYTQLLADCYISVHCMGYTFFLRGGGTTGAIYHFASDQVIDPKVYYNGSSDLVWSNSNTVYNIYAFAPVSIVNTDRLNSLKIAKESSVNKVDNKVSEIEVNLSSITSRVSNVESKQTNIDGKVVSLESWKREAEQKITDSSIISVVSKQFYSKGETDSKYTTQSQLTQLNDSFEFKLTQSGSPNIVKNSDFSGNLNQWRINGNPKLSTHNPHLNERYGKMMSIIGNANEGIYQTIDTIPGEVYTVSFYAESHGVQSLATQIGIEDVKAISLSSDYAFNRHRFTFIATKTSHVFIAYLKASGRFYIGRIMVSKGDVLQEYRKHSNEIYSTNAKFDVDGMTIDSTNVDVNTNFNADGMAIKRKSTGQDLLKADRSGITAYSGRFQVVDPDNGTTRFWGRDIVINDQRALVGTGNTAQGEMIRNKLYINYLGDFANGVEIGGVKLTNNGSPILSAREFRNQANGFIRLNNGLIIQWGRKLNLNVIGGVVDSFLSFPLAFPNVCFSCITTLETVDKSNWLSAGFSHSCRNYNTSSAWFYARNLVNGEGSKMDVSFIAIGM